MAGIVCHAFLRVCNQGADVARRRMAEVDEDVRVDVRDLRVTDAVTLEAALVDEAACADVLDLLEDGPGAGMPVEPGMLAAAPAQVFLRDPVKHRRILALELKGR